jgi:hypothetical protein
MLCEKLIIKDEEVVVAYFNYFKIPSQNMLEGLIKTTYSLDQDSGILVQDLNLGAPEYEAEMLNT